MIKMKETIPKLSSFLAWNALLTPTLIPQHGFVVKSSFHYFFLERNIHEKYKPATAIVKS